MQKWEYLYVVRNRWVDKNYKTENFQTQFSLPQKQTMNDPEDFLPILGEEGWELASTWALSSILGGHIDGWAGTIEYAGFTTQEKWVFKRPKPE